jgi:hypothetical protein
MSALTTHTFGNQREKKTGKKQIKRNSNKRSKAEKGKEQDHLKRTSLGPLRQGQRLDTSETKPCSSKEHKPPKHTGAPPAHKQTPPEQVPTLGTNRSGRFPKPVRSVPPKPVRPVPKTGQADFTQQTTPPKAKNAKEMHKLPLDSWDRFQGCNATFLHPSFSPLLPMHESRLKFEKNCNLELLKYTKFITRCYTCPNEQVRYSTAS